MTLIAEPVGLGNPAVPYSAQMLVREEVRWLADHISIVRLAPIQPRKFIVMSSSNFIITEHWSPCQLIREYPHAVKRDDAELFLSVKEYRPCSNADPDDGSITVIASHGNGFPKVREGRLLMSCADMHRNAMKSCGTSC